MVCTPVAARSKQQAANSELETWQIPNWANGGLGDTAPVISTFHHNAGTAEQATRKQKPANRPQTTPASTRTRQQGDTMGLPSTGSSSPSSAAPNGSGPYSNVSFTGAAPSGCFTGEAIRRANEQTNTSTYTWEQPDLAEVTTTTSDSWKPTSNKRQIWKQTLRAITTRVPASKQRGANSSTHRCFIQSASSI